MEPSQPIQESLTSMGDAPGNYASTVRLTLMRSIPDAEIVKHLLALSAEIESEFRSLEHKMDVLGYCGLSGYREQHAHVLRAIHRVIPITMTGNLHNVRQLIEILPGYLQFQRQVVMQELLKITQSPSSDCHIGAGNTLHTRSANCADFDDTCFPTYLN